LLRIGRNHQYHSITQYPSSQTLLSVQPTLVAALGIDEDVFVRPSFVGYQVNTQSTISLYREFADPYWLYRLTPAGHDRHRLHLALGEENTPLLLQVDGLIMPGLVELCTPHLVQALVIGATERHGRSKPNVEIAEIFESAYQFLGVELGATTL